MMPMKQGYEYELVDCPECGEGMPRNWLVRHMKAEHPVKPCDHCWHNLGQALNLSPDPPKYDLICCRCGKRHVLLVNPANIWKDGEHGEHMDKIPMQYRRKA